MIKIIIEIDTARLTMQGYKDGKTSQAQIEFAQRIRDWVNEEAVRFGQENGASKIITRSRDIPEA